MGQRADRLISHHAGMIEYFLELADCCGALPCGQICLASEIDRIEREREVIVRMSQFVWPRGRQCLHGACRIAAFERQSGSDHRQVIELNNGVLREPFCKIVCQARGVCGIACERAR